MNRTFFTLIALAGFFFIACDKEDDEVVLTPYEMLTAHVWVSDSLLADGQDAGGEGELLEKFNGDAEFRTDGTGTFGEYTGSWVLSADNKELTITTNQFPVPIVTTIRELTLASLKVTTNFPDMSNPGETIAIRMTFLKK
jgi:hypothetical protein